MQISSDITFGKDNGLGRRYILVGTIARKRQSDREPWILPTGDFTGFYCFYPFFRVADAMAFAVENKWSTFHYVAV